MATDAMTDAGEKLDAPLWNRGRQFRGPHRTWTDDLVEGHVRAELERAAGIADISGEPVIAAAIRKLKE